MKKEFAMQKEFFEAIHTRVTERMLDGEQVLQVEKIEKIWDFDENTYAKLKHFTFTNGTIEVSVRSQLLPDAPALARGFIGLAFRIDDNDSRFESFYIRPTNGNHSDLVRANRASQYFAYPDYKFDYFREQGITDYEAPAEIALDEWIVLKAEISGQQAVFYVNGKKILEVADLKLGADQSGNIGLFVDIGTRGFFKDLKVISID
ncbi:hypothetical protein [Streptococcus merionis]|uniref:3-keto-disaccharide hydrolase domain-containing protein n=1 Tax=Streptococcus merionis TaxID=400065 RepID=A0A239SPE5_9STRE|nr:hypothetical protein [Streptococcus merionis]SNU87132.1 Uncharacterised protein [Streptococcus merionis]